MKKIFALLIATACISATVAAQDSTKVPLKQKIKLKNELNLSKAQGKELKSIHSDYKSKISTVKEDKSLSEKQKKEKIGTLLKERQEKINSQLTPEQQAKLEVLKKEQKEKKRSAKTV